LGKRKGDAKLNRGLNERKKDYKLFKVIKTIEVN
jgi:hypothetical protein